MKNTIYHYLIIFSAALLLVACKESKDISYENIYYKLSLSKVNGAIKSIEKNGKNMIAMGNAENALFEICFRDTAICF